ncbi:hypothetical protein C8F04DRAFT_447027 [Mycena alexandri]|uniref:Uncharacterized protein n=1 Tax=Mycena alexandri TaxID=1745969 RepID=A0AAD6TK52_9AGAR|nr:hypothetical protein C8F04DRAFT_447027 [Mycena alexandri]
MPSSHILSTLQLDLRAASTIHASFSDEASILFVCETRHHPYSLKIYGLLFQLDLRNTRIIQILQNVQFRLAARRDIIHIRSQFADDSTCAVHITRIIPNLDRTKLQIRLAATRRHPYSVDSSPQLALHPNTHIIQILPRTTHRFNSVWAHINRLFQTRLTSHHRARPTIISRPRAKLPSRSPHSPTIRGPHYYIINASSCNVSRDPSSSHSPLHFGTPPYSQHGLSQLLMSLSCKPRNPRSPIAMALHMPNQSSSTS